jgi:hypothetical protein
MAGVSLFNEQPVFAGLLLIIAEILGIAEEL